MNVTYMIWSDSFEKVSFITYPLFLVLTACKNQPTANSSQSSVPVQNLSTSSQTTLKQSTASSESSTTTNKEATEQATHQSSSPTVPSATSQSLPSSEETDPLAGYSDLQIEYARVWLATMGTSYKEALKNSEFELQVRHNPAGSAINPYETNSAVYPEETVTLFGKYGYQSLIVYSSNHDGTITQYPVPSHFQGKNDTNEESNKILNSTKQVSIPTNNPEDIKELIDVLVIIN
ncbi:hypothetical protein IGI37_001263 [Enterococcus sp. AZ194]|uniref:hypothetical protein n=1 Tax=Enterococcus sp. AZ194 TaxID=2774629 RepID=UPI003F23E6E4